MSIKMWRSCVLVAVGALVTFSGVRAGAGKSTDGGKAEEFKEKAYDLKEKEKVVVTLVFPAGKEATITTGGDKKTDVHLFVYDGEGKEVAKDDSPGPDCEIKITPKAAGKHTLEVRNLGPGANRVTLKVEFVKAKE
jgi:hypothetical protein